MSSKTKVDLKTFIYIDILQPQVASFLATVSQGYLPVEGQASLYVEMTPGIAINSLTDIALKKTKVHPGMQIVERESGVLELHSYDQGLLRAAGDAILEETGLKETDRIKPRIESHQIINGIHEYHSMLINRMRHGDMILKMQTLLVLETYPAGYALFAANEAEKAANIHLLEVRAMGAFGRLYLGGSEEDINQASEAILKALNSVEGRIVQK
ncbi:MAG: hypothetical protein U0354_09940 [Candidatus Sericytochromatia bacterium]